MAVQVPSPTNAEHTPQSACTGAILAATAHELRLPLSHIKGFVSSLRRTDVMWDQETKNEFLAEIETEADRLGELIDVLLTDPSLDGSVTAGNESELTSPTRVVQDALHRVRGLLGDRQVRVDVSHGLPPVRMHRDGMERVIANLLQNAVKYSPAGSPIRVSARLTQAGELELTVEDHGPGVPTEDRQRIFQPFFRRNSQVAGHGLGLAIAQSIVQAHSGQIRVTARPGGGARFAVRLPGRSMPAS